MSLTQTKVYFVIENTLNIQYTKWTNCF